MKTPTPNMSRATINQMQYTDVLITNKIAPEDPEANKKPQNKPPTWQQWLMRQIGQL